MRKTFYLIIAMLVVLAGCKESAPEPVETSFSVNAEQINTSLRVTVNPSAAEQTYVFGIFEIEDASAIENLINEYAVKAISENRVVSGISDTTFSDLKVKSQYCIWVAQVDNGAVTFTPTHIIRKIDVAKDYYSFVSNEWVAPIAISDNGLWVVGTASEASYIFDVINEKYTFIEGVALYDITDDGVAFGMDLTLHSALIYRNDTPEYPDADSKFNESCFFSVTPDGTQAVGYVMDEESVFKAVLYKNGKFEILPSFNGPESDMGAKEAVYMIAKGISADGIIAGYFVDENYSVEMSCVWNSPVVGNASFANSSMTWNPEWMWYNMTVGRYNTYISSNGNYIASNVIDYGPDGWGETYYSYIYDVRNDKITIFNDSSLAGFRVDGVSNNGDVFYSDAILGFSSVPYIVPNGESKVMTLQEYLSKTYSYDFTDRKMEGSFISVTEDCKGFVVGNYQDDGFATSIYYVK